MAKQVLYTLSLGYNLLRNHVSPQEWRWWHHVRPRLILGALPLADRMHHDILVSQHSVRHVLTLNEPFELDPSVLAQPVSETQWQDLGVNHRVIPMEDFSPSSFENINQGADFIHESLSSGVGSVYVHCKAGRGRSAMVVACYLIKYERMDVEQALTYIELKRPNVKMGPGQLSVVSQFGLWLARNDRLEQEEDRME
eukprot:TRINITY_DN8631_c0_g1_i1.p1 TRINITY_DN8631_c0_g1~~TRINITY_DN8631_c0_g1_i1.p1  ORF type:complete len:197 (-),score=32.32 TRINITY_DN8631_c0_g1_i1:212-802(-)